MIVAAYIIKVEVVGVADQGRRRDPPRVGLEELLLGLVEVAPLTIGHQRFIRCLGVVGNGVGCQFILTAFGQPLVLVKFTV